MLCGCALCNAQHCNRRAMDTSFSKFHFLILIEIKGFFFGCCCFCCLFLFFYIFSRIHCRFVVSPFSRFFLATITKIFQIFLQFCKNLCNNVVFRSRFVLLSPHQYRPASTRKSSPLKTFFLSP